MATRIALPRLRVIAPGKHDAAYPGRRNNGGCRSPLMFSVMFGHKEIGAHLIEVGADTKSQTVFGVAAQQIARIKGALRSLGSIFS